MGPRDAVGTASSAADVAPSSSPPSVPFTGCGVRNGSGYTGGIREALRSRELYKYILLKLLSKTYWGADRLYV